MDWDDYWQRAGHGHRGVFPLLAAGYRKQIISRFGAWMLSRYFRDESDRQYLHAGCGSGGSDQRMMLNRATFHLLDLSPIGLSLARQHARPAVRRFVCGNLFALPYRDASFDGIYNFGVMEHFTEASIGEILAEFRRVLKRDGRVVLFWPPNFGLSVMVLSAWCWLVNRFRTQPLQFFPDEVSRVPSFRWVRRLMETHGFKTLKVHFTIRDLFTFVVVVAEPAA